MDPALVEEIRSKVNAYLSGRDAAGRVHQRRSRRQLAREIGMSPMGLEKFAAGAKPYRPTYQRLAAWYAGVSMATTDEYVGHLLGLLVETLPEAHRTRALADLRVIYQSLHARYSSPDLRSGQDAVRVDVCRLCIPPIEVPYGQLQRHIQEAHGPRSE